ncbi:MAG: hypothetical protein K9G42_01585, partial [Pedobacter sp.]|nr:hypothetical protein [Pedobacter sp.]
IDYSTNFRTVYQTLLQALIIALKKDFGYVPERAVSSSNKVGNDVAAPSCEDESSSCSCSSAGSSSPDYTRNIETEMNIEKL